jgi:hypothetical protein
MRYRFGGSSLLHEFDLKSTTSSINRAPQSLL